MKDLMEIINKQPNNINARMELAKRYLDKQDYTQAKSALEELIKIDSDNLDANFLLGQLYEFDEEFSLAVKCLEKIVRQRPTVELSYKLGQLYENCDEYDKALILYKSCYQATPQDNNLCERIAHVNRILGNKSEAIEFYIRLLQLSKDDIVALTQLMELYEEENNTFLYYLTKARINELEESLSQAISSYKKALALVETKEDAIKIRLAIADIQIKKENYLQAVDEFQAIIDQDNNYYAYIKLAEVYIKLDNPDAACEAYEKALEMNPGNEDILNELSDLYSELEEPQKAIEIIEKLIKINPNNLSNHVSLAKSYIGLSQDLKAEEKLNFVLEKDPNNVEAISVYVDYYSLKKNYEKALECVEKIKQLIPKSPFGYKKAGEIFEVTEKPFESHYNFGIYHDLKGEKDLALDEFNWALEQSPKNIEIILRAAKLYEEISEEYIAAEYYQRAYSIDKQNINALQKMSEIYMKKKDYQQAIDIYNEILKLTPSAKEEYFLIAEAYEKAKNYDLALENYNKYLNIANLSVKSDEAKSRIKKIESKINGEEDEGLLNKLFRIFSK